MLALRIARQDAVADRVHQVGLAQPDAAVEKERVVGHRGRLGHRLRGGVGEAVRIPDDEVVEGVARVEVSGPQFVGHRPPDGPAPRSATLSVPGARIDDHAQRDLGAEDVVQHAGDVVLEPVLDPIAGKRRVHGEHDFVGRQLDQAHRLEPHLEDRLVVARFEQLQRRRPEVRGLGIREGSVHPKSLP